ncbi:MAG TPA: hypothetical protein DCE41_20215 [Cytophagales bacterium]|nr:hypothetical protein [Cytophagales bacterium]HAA21795.1 hypothetical protein [Cytophagales bacterium]HAP59287.1 hypothetical protein [Cytophagales bacterium]
MIPFELHLSTTPLAVDRLAPFQALCERLGTKALVIELDKGQTQTQPMLSEESHFASLEAALSHCQQLSQQFQQAGFDITRVKLEVPVEYAIRFENTSQNYFEWHGKILLSEIDRAQPCCEAFQVHLSKNGLSTDTQRRFLTLRVYGTPTEFQAQVAQFKECLTRQSIEVDKDRFEYCVFDDNVDLDAGWTH